MFFSDSANDEELANEGVTGRLLGICALVGKRVTLCSMGFVGAYGFADHACQHKSTNPETINIQREHPSVSTCSDILTSPQGT